MSHDGLRIIRSLFSHCFPALPARYQFRSTLVSLKLLVLHRTIIGRFFVSQLSLWPMLFYVTNIINLFYKVMSSICFFLQCKIGCSIWKFGLIDSCQAVCVSKRHSITKYIFPVSYTFVHS